MVSESGSRQFPRVRDDIPVNWSMASSDEQGRGILRNLSQGGAMLETKSRIDIRRGVSLALRAGDQSESLLVPSMARPVWGKEAKSDRGYFFYGLEFKDISGDCLTAIRDRVENKMQSLYHGLGSGISDMSV